MSLSAGDSRTHSSGSRSSESIETGVTGVHSSGNQDVGLGRDTNQGCRRELPERVGKQFLELRGHSSKTPAGQQLIVKHVEH